MTPLYVIKIVHADGSATLFRPYPDRHQADHWSRAWRRVGGVVETFVIVHRPVPPATPPAGGMSNTL